MTRKNNLTIGYIICPLLLICLLVTIVLLIYFTSSIHRNFNTIDFLYIVLLIEALPWCLGLLTILLTASPGYGNFRLWTSIFFRKNEEQYWEDISQVDLVVHNQKYLDLNNKQILDIISWSWEAYCFPHAWLIINKLYGWLFLSVLPFINIYVWILVAKNGKKIAWEKYQYALGYDAFYDKQNTLRIGLICLLTFILLGIIVSYMSYKIIS